MACDATNCIHVRSAAAGTDDWFVGDVAVRAYNGRSTYGAPTNGAIERTSLARLEYNQPAGGRQMMVDTSTDTAGAGPSRDDLFSLQLVVGLVLAGTAVLAVTVIAATPAGATPQGQQTAWQNDTQGFGAQPSVAVDADGHAHVSYLGTTKNSVKLEYARWNGSSWHNQTVDATGRVGYHSDIELDTDGDPHIAYLNRNGDLKYAELDSGSWQIQTVVTGSAGSDISLAVDDGGNPHISYYDSKNADLEYATYNGVSWIRKQVVTSGSVGSANAIAVDGAGTPHIAYYDQTNGDLEYATRTRNGGSWARRLLDAGGTVGWSLDIAVNDNGVAHVSYFDSTNADLKYAMWDGKAHVETVDSQGAVGSENSITLDRNGNPHIAYFDSSNNNLKYAYADGNSWSGRSLGTQSQSGRQPSIALDDVDNPVIAHVETGNAKPNVVVTQQLTAPTAPQSLSASASAEQVTLSWSSPKYDGRASIQGYEVYRDDGSGMTAVATVSDTNYTDTGLSNGKQYEYVVRALNTVGSGPKSKTVSATPAGKPGTPTALGVSAGNEQVELSWSAPRHTGGTPIQQYTVYRDDGSGMTAVTTVSGTNYTDTNLTNGQSYTYQVSATSTEGEGPVSNQITATPDGPPAAPGSVGAEAGKNRIVLEWEKPADNGGSQIVDYRIYRATNDGDSQMTQIATVAAHSPVYEDTSVTPGTKYTYEIRAVNGNGESTTGTTTTATLAVPNTETPEPETPEPESETSEPETPESETPEPERPEKTLDENNASDNNSSGDTEKSDAGGSSGIPPIMFAAGLLAVGGAGVTGYKLSD